MSFYSETKNSGCPKYNWIVERVEEINNICNKLFMAEDDFNTPEIRIACQKLEEAEYWLKRSNYQWDSVEQMADSFGVKLEEKEE